MTDTIKSAVMERLRQIKGPDLEGDIVSLGLVSDVFVSDGRVVFSITVPAERAQELEPLRQAAEKVVKEVDGVETVMVALTAERAAGGARNAAPQSAPKPAPQQPRRPAEEQAPAKPGVPGIKHIVAVASGKGGVGKSTTTANLALAMASLGKKVGVLDADIYGPSVPRLFNVSGRPEALSGRMLKPMEGYGIKVMSMGFMVEEETPMIWRGPMVISALTQMLREVAWGELDVLVVDMPPGTGDAQLTMAQQVPLAGAVIVSTPQDLALIDARKGLNMFKRVDVPVLGIVENMSYFLCPDCGGRHDIFGHGGARAEADRLKVPFLGEVPLTMKIRETSDAGTPVVVSDPEGSVAGIYKDIAAKVLDSIDRESAEPTRAAPNIVFD
ncbi:MULTISPECIES: Mrp/NBP35 family ATP-binding protein [Stappiaceae]|jgi:ATP-binding protein involved in chromosome partitioning|uniref:Mrp/NBP35 family ATP-binding protein n=1 Tax=Stappiaceae TaxID=2821832 RepID=UPI00094B2E7E|nr:MULTISPECIES: Mrp/NBP35 family ATP-binding protein [Stappiaceae]MCR9282329.1 Mrp/NBP35 family ATP-binding protein [Paracoccaceae bacterium]MEC9470056.1 Mrp/NBP35 family ATP-binding protein [Pseudomonadota bacterium]MBO9458774.1 Mrp/NBP35 family ATP-binding protein [Labrenzia sp. R5_0]MEE2867726.1 Mrp/NBP35 family ATP-binding protein [Pseudomonadota bacterium]UFI01473.1 Mrp/NBP35 family ATP-binding protein [Roseibium aggregatum]